ncbi:LysR family transcriptional regulator [Roseiarcaceae bacterium H3SJ34-1]|uniref:LysR family transcriptional regulator n=1 Tax=Terripilifer ovatus TaxID=3032367 RepID=UPI003AB99E04|nr:LysR family transcriptional regulator [Roseiarcaceae bacterium H3SJ34-1]
MSLKSEHSLELRRLRAFDEAAERGSLVAAAAALRVSQPAVSYLLNQLEADVGCPLLSRGAQGSRLTDNGRLFHRRVQRCLQQVRDAVENVSGDVRSARRRDVTASRITGTQCKSILALWSFGSVRQAGERLGVSERAVVRPVQELERLLSATLIQSTGHRAELTQAGREFARRLVLAGQEIWSAMEEIGGAQSSRKSLRIGALVLSPRLILAEALEAALAEQPSYTVEIIEGSYEELVVLLRDGSIDVIFGALRAPPPFSDLSETPLQPDPYVVAARRGHPLSKLKRIKVRDLSGYDFVFPTAGLRHDVLMNLIAQWKLTPKAQVHTSWLPTIIALIRSSDRLAVLSQWHVETDGTSDIQSLDGLRVPHEDRYVGLTSRSSWLPTPFQACFVGALQKMTRLRTDGAQAAG